MNKIISLLTVALFTALFYGCNTAKNSSSNQQEDTVVKETKEDEIPQKKFSLNDVIEPNAEIKTLAEGLQFLEGPIWDAVNNQLIFSEVMANKLHSWSATDGVQTYLEPSWYAGGNFMTKEGNILLCQGGARQIALIKPDKSSEIVVNSFEGKKFNSPNDIVQKSDGTIWFTDPDYGLLAAYGQSIES